MRNARVVGVVLAGSILIVSSLALAGQRETQGVYISTANKWAQGSLGSARNSADSVQYIACSVTSNTYVYCSARNASGTYVYCDGYSASIAQTVSAMDSSALINFYWTGGSTSGTCSSVTVSHSSTYEPKAP